VSKGTAKASDYSLKRLVALMRYLDDGAVPIDNNPVENTIRPWVLGRSNWLIAGSLHSGKRAAAIMSLIQSARMNGHDPYAYLKDVLTRLPTQRVSASTNCCRINGRLPEPLTVTWADHTESPLMRHPLQRSANEWPESSKNRETCCDSHCLRLVTMVTASGLLTERHVCF